MAINAYHNVTNDTILHFVILCLLQIPFAAELFSKKRIRYVNKDHI